MRKNRKHKITYKKNIDDDDDMMQTESSNENETDTNLIKSLDQFGGELKYKLAKMHEQFKIKIDTDHANELAKEIRDEYWQLSTTKKNQAIILSRPTRTSEPTAIGWPLDILMSRRTTSNW